MTEHQRVRPLVEGAFLALITAILGALAIYFLPVKFLVDYIWGIPIIIIIKRYNLKIGMLTLTTTFLLTWMFTEPVTTLLLVVELAPMALAYGLLFKNDISPGTVLVTGSIVSLFSTILTVLGFIYIAGINIIPTKEFLLLQAQQAIDTYENMGLINPADSKQMVEMTLKFMTVLIPSALVMASVIRAFFTYIITVRVLRRLGYKAQSLPSFSEWRLPWYSIWLVIAGLGLILIGDYYKLSVIATTGKNMIFIIIPVFLTVGLAVGASFFKSWNAPGWIKTFIVLVSLLNLSGTLVIFTIIGLFDPVVSFRDWKTPKD